MKWYHYTGLTEFKLILANEALLSFYQKMRERHKDDTKRIEDQIRSRRASEGEREYQRWNYVYLTPDNDRPSGSHNDVVLGFELNQTPNLGGILILPRVGLETLVDIGAKRIHLPTVREILQVSHNGKYKSIPVYEEHSCL